jgi:hypothetical protein
VGARSVAITEGGNDDAEGIVALESGGIDEGAHVRVNFPWKLALAYVERPDRQEVVTNFELHRTVRSYVRLVGAVMTAGHDECRGIDVSDQLCAL